MTSGKKSSEDIVKETFEITSLPRGTKVTVTVKGKVVKEIRA